MCTLFCFSLDRKKEEELDSFLRRQGAHAKKKTQKTSKRRQLTARPRVLGVDVDHRVLDVRRAPHRRDGARGRRERGLEVHGLRGGEQVVGDPDETFFLKVFFF